MKRTLFAIPVILASCSLQPITSSKEEQYFLAEVKPVLQQQCLRCHNGTMPIPVLNLTSKSTAFKRGAKGLRFIVPGDPDHSLLVSAIQRGGTHPKKMPHADISLTDDQIGMLREWITDGAFWPEGERGHLRPEKSGENP